MPQAQCPFCDAMNSVAVTAAGRTVRCQSCQTMFLVPMDVASQSEEAAACRAGPAVPTGPRVPAESLTPAKAESSASCSSGTSIPTPLPCGGIASASTASMASAQRVSVRDGDDVDYRRGSGGGMLAAYVLVGVACLALAGVLLAVLFLRMNEDQSIADAPEETGVVYLTPRGSHEATWADASREIVVSMNEVAVKVDYVCYGGVRAKNELNEVIFSDDTNYLQVYVDLKNTGATIRNYTSWYGQSYMTVDGEVAATLLDDQGRQYEMTRFTHVHAVKGHTSEARLLQGDSAKDVVIFVIPESVDRRSIRHFHLELPAACYGDAGVYRFEIQPASIENFGS